MKEFLAIAKLKILAVISWVYVFLAPIHVLILLIGAFIVFDTIAGRWSAKQIALKNGKDVRLEVTSKKTRKGLLSKMITYQIAIIVFFVLDDYLLHDLVKYFWSDFPVDYIITKAVGMLLIMVEFDSIDEKYYKAKGVRLKTIISKQIRGAKNLVHKSKDFKDEIDN